MASVQLSDHLLEIQHPVICVFIFLADDACCLKQLHNVERRFYCPMRFHCPHASLLSPCVSELRVPVYVQSRSDMKLTFRD